MSDDDVFARAAGVRGDNPFYTCKQAAYVLGVSVRHLERLRAKGEGPPFRRHSRTIRYYVLDLKQWSDSTRRLVRKF